MGENVNYVFRFYLFSISAVQHVNI